MSKLNSLMDRFKSPKKEKMNQLVERSTSGNLSSFSGVFHICPISKSDKSFLHALLEKHKTTNLEVSSEDLQYLSTITAEIKAISNQAVILHGERIKKAQALLKKYSDGAFTAWLMKAYGNRQTPYNFLQYYELYTSLSKPLQNIIDEMPRQAIYSLSSRSVPQEKKVAFIKNYQGETKGELLEKLRRIFPLAKKDKRTSNRAKTVIDQLKQTLKTMEELLYTPSEGEKKTIQALVNQIQVQL